MQYPTEIQPGMKMETLGTLQPQQFEMGGVVPRTYFQNYDNIMLQGVGGQAQALGFKTPLFQSTLEEYESSARAKDLSELSQQRQAGVPKSSYFGFANTSSGPTNYLWSTTPFKNLNLSTNTVPFRYNGGSWTDQNPSRSDYRTQMGREMVAKNTELRSVRLY